MRVLDQSAQLLCAHGIPFSVAQGNASVVLNRQQILTEKMLLDAKPTCTVAGPGIVKCSKVVQVLMGKVGSLVVGGSPALDESLLFLTDGSPLAPGRVAGGGNAHGLQRAGGSAAATAVRGPAQSGQAGAAARCYGPPAQPVARSKIGEAREPYLRRVSAQAVFWQLSDGIAAIEEVRRYGEFPTFRWAPFAGAALETPACLQDAISDLPRPDKGQVDGAALKEILLDLESANSIKRVQSALLPAVPGVAGAVFSFLVEFIPAVGMVLAVKDVFDAAANQAYPEKLLTLAGLSSLIQAGGRIERVRWLSRRYAQQAMPESGNDLAYNELLTYQIEIGDAATTVVTPLQHVRVPVVPSGVTAQRLPMQMESRRAATTGVPEDVRIPSIWNIGGPGDERVPRQLGAGSKSEPAALRSDVLEPEHVHYLKHAYLADRPESEQRTRIPEFSVFTQQGRRFRAFCPHLVLPSACRVGSEKRMKLDEAQLQHLRQVWRLQTWPPPAGSLPVVAALGGLVLSKVPHRAAESASTLQAFSTLAAELNPSPVDSVFELLSVLLVPGAALIAREKLQPRERFWFEPLQAAAPPTSFVRTISLEVSVGRNKRFNYPLLQLRLPVGPLDPTALSDQGRTAQ